MPKEKTVNLIFKEMSELAEQNPQLTATEIVSKYFNEKRDQVEFKNA